MYPFKKYFILISLILSSLFLSAQSSELITFESINQGTEYLYNPFFGKAYTLRLYHYNYFDELGGDGSFSTDFYLIGSEYLNFLNSNPSAVDYSDIFSPQTGYLIFSDSVFGTLIQTTFSNKNLFDSALDSILTNNPENAPDSIMNATMYPLEARYIGYYFIPRETALYYSYYGQNSFDFTTFSGLTLGEQIDFLNDFEIYSSNEFQTWYSNTSFTDRYGLVTENLTDEANAVIDLSFAAFTTPTPFTVSSLKEAASDIIFFSDDQMLSLFTFSSVAADGTITLGERIKHFGSLLDDGTIDNIFEAELFNMWFVTEFLLSDAYPLWMYSMSGQSALSLHQIAIDTILPTAVAKSTILKKQTSNQSDRPKEGEVVIKNSSPVGDTALMVFNTYNRLGQMAKVSSALDYKTPKGRFEFGSSLNYIKTLYNYNNRTYDTLDFNIKGQINLLKDTAFPIHIFDGIGVTLNDLSLMANYINANMGIYQEIKTRFVHVTFGEILLGKYWSQFPQMDVKSLTALRLSFNLFGLGSLSADVIYTKALGVLYDSEWTNYDGANTDYLNIGVGTDLNFSDSFSLNISARKDFLMEGFSSLEFALGAAFVF